MISVVHHLSSNVETIVVYVLATVVSAFVVWAGKSIAKLVKNQSAIHDQVMGIPGVGYPSIRDQFTEIRNHLCKQDKTLENLEHEVQDNSGSSLKDAVKLVNKDVNSIKKEVMPVLTDLSKKILDINNRLDRHLDLFNDNKES